MTVYIPVTVTLCLLYIQKKKRVTPPDVHSATETTRGNTMFKPEMTPPVSPGMPCNTVTLLLTKYSLQVALNSGPSQNRLHSLVVTVTLPITSVLRHLSKFWFCRVRFPNMQTLRRRREKKSEPSYTNTSGELQLLFNKVVYFMV